MVLERVAATGLLADGEPVVVLLSGGRDSVCLLDCAVALGAHVTALHVNYGLRDEAADDESFCRGLCERVNVPLVVERTGTPEGNVQAWARDVRFAAARRVAQGAPVATGHTATDQAETVLYRLAASPGRRALLGMSARDGDVIRPLLSVTREETAEHNRQRGLTWREDATNPATKRGRIRALLDDLHPAAERNIVRTAELLREEAAVLDEVVDTALAGRDHIPLATLRALPPALARLVIRRLAENATQTLCARAATRLDDVLALDDGALDLGDGARAVVEAGILRMVPTPPLPAHA
jgi:tRNA(Ile)-lysidine synthase